ncbi:ABC transporter permease subunit [Bacillus sp. es.036]|uniref:ABC transporter permease subunit n=1 Tax=Bacillus sp. es.036 TaxID=1761764 RepID=UPI000BF7FD0E|nr:ABC transporter permease subunit [Bacillus sp. es.036]PFG14645.1 ABC-2 type transport system permease protein [Bacillus sp. es.036]
MNITLYAKMLKVHAKSISSYAIGSALYLLLIIGIYPSIADAPGLNELMESMPESFLAAFGMEGGFQHVSDFIAGEYYGLLYVVILSIFCLMTASQLMARHIDRGSMAYILATPNSRKKIAFTQALVLITGLLIIGLTTALAGVIGTEILIEDKPFEAMTFMNVNLVGILLFYVISGYSFLFSSMLNDERQALGISGLLTIVFYGMDLVGKMSDKLDWMVHLSLFSTFRPVEIARGSVDVWPTATFLFLLGTVLYAVAILIFSKRDLPL